MKPHIKNGILYAGNQRVVLAKVSGWQVEINSIILGVDGQRLTLNLSSEVHAVDGALSAWMMAEQEKRDHPLMAVFPPKPDKAESPKITVESLAPKRNLASCEIGDKDDR